MFFFFPQSVLAESQPRLPLICILTTCSDPSLKIETLAKQKEMELQSLSMGQVPPPSPLSPRRSGTNWNLLFSLFLSVLCVGIESKLKTKLSFIVLYFQGFLYTKNVFFFTSPI